MPESSLLNPDLIQINVEAQNKEQIIKSLAKLLISGGYVRESYMDAVLEREKVFPTGLPTEGVGVSIPHADIKHVIKPAIAVAILRNPVKFDVMGNPDESVDVKLVFMLAIKESNMQVNMLKNLVSVFQDKKLLLKLANTSNKNNLISLLEPFINTNYQKDDTVYESVN
ncbi:MAG: galactitol system component [Thermoanaerobacteraceae bacterium]|jgi:PTS system galactitol-specific IIA component|nr:galactitol system component [Thermoanaerobacteraceae bacterium]MDN5313403.1 galactitol system component [Thermoanaerobacteraceae bacterium]RKL63405.1 PTS sugar transporter subunit IIA [Thermoanaerobacteraceae bacterium SP2]